MRRSRSRQEQEQQQQHMVAIWAGGATSGGMRGNDVSTASDRTQCVCVSTETSTAGEKGQGLGGVVSWLSLYCTRMRGNCGGATGRQSAHVYMRGGVYVCVWGGVTVCGIDVYTPAALLPPPTHASSHDDHHRLMAASTRNLHFRRTTRAKGSRRKRRSVDRWYFRISFSARVPGLYRLGFLALPPAPPTTRRGLACFLPLFGVPLRAEAPPTRVLPVGYFVRAIAPRRAGPARAVQAGLKHVRGRDRISVFCSNWF